MRRAVFLIALLTGCATGESHVATDRDGIDAGRRPDAGSRPRDASGERDAPISDLDSGPIADAGPGARDAGPTTRDAGPRPRDSGPPPCMCTPAACTTTCGSTGTTSCADPCRPSCTPPAETCNAADDDCDGTCDMPACRAGVHRSVHPTSGEHFYTRDRAEAACCGFTVETYDYFFVYPDAQPGLVPFYRCLLGTGFHFYTTSASCEGSPGSRMEGILGHVAPSPTCGSTPLYRLWHPSDGHFYTTSASERDSAVATGYVDEGSPVQVWPR